MAVTTPYAPNSPRRPRSGKTYGFSSGSSPQGMNDPRSAAMGLFDAGTQIGPQGQAMPTRDFGGLMQGYSSQFNSMSRGAKPGQFSSLGTPLNSMYANNPGFFTRAPSGQSRADVQGLNFGAQIAQRNQAPAVAGAPAAPAGRTRADNIAQAKKDGTFTQLVDQYNLNSPDGYMDDEGNIHSTVTQDDLRERRGNYWAEQAKGKKLLDQYTGKTPTVSTPSITYENGKVVPQMGGARNIEGRYGSGFIDPTGLNRRQPGQEGLINGRPASEVLQGFANKPGIARPGDKFQPQSGNSFYGQPDPKKKTKR